MIKLTRIETPTFLANNPDIKNAKRFMSPDGLSVLTSCDNTPKWGWLRHASVARPDRYPSWDEITEIKERFLGDKDCMMVIPKKEDYVNLHNNCFHVWQCPQEWGMR
jgi:hypothetical protein